MKTALESGFVSVADYLSGEEASGVRHEYIEGVVYAMAGTSDVHNTVAGNFFAAMHSHLRGGRCRAFISDVKVRLNPGEKQIFYYPDVMVACDGRDTNAFFKDFPKVIVEVLSEGMERIDRSEKFPNYTQIESLEEFVLASQDKMEVTIFRRAQGWKPEILRQPDQSLALASLNFSMRLQANYEGVEF